jgi:glycosyltransferase 2 family protein
MQTEQPTLSPGGRIIQQLKKWRSVLSPIVAIIILGIFFYWIWNYRDIIKTTFTEVGIIQITIIILLICLSFFVTIFTFTILVKDKGYKLAFIDGYHAINLSQLASMIPGKIWGFAGLVALFRAKGISTMDSVLIIFINTLISLSAAVVIGILGLIPVIGWGLTLLCLLPFLVLIIGRPWLEKLGTKFYPGSTGLPSTSSMLAVLMLAIIQWFIVSACFAWFVDTSAGSIEVSFITTGSAFAAGYLGGFISMLAPSGLGVSEGIVTVILSPFIPTEKILSIAISFRIIHTLVIWVNIFITLIFSKFEKQGNPDAVLINQELG